MYFELIGHPMPFPTEPIVEAKQCGLVKWFDNCKRYGFISRPGDAPDVFVHDDCVRASDRPLKQGDSVVFDVIEGRRGLRATAVVRL